MKTLHLMLRRPIQCGAAVLCLANICTPAAAINWTNLVSSDWNIPGNWNPPLVPGPSDTATIATPGVTVTLSSGTTVGAIILGANSGGTVKLSLNGQTLALNGPLTVNPSGSFTVDSGSLVGVTNAVLSGALGWTAGSLGGTLTLASGGTLSISGNSDHNLPNCVLTNNGSVVWLAGRIRGGSGSPGTFIYNNNLWDAKDDLTLNNDYGGNGTRFNNEGTFRKSGSTAANGVTVLSGGVFFVNTGEIEVQTNSLSFQGGGNFTGGTATNTVGAVVFNAGAFNLNGTVTSTNVQLAGGTLTGNNVFQGGFTWFVGDWSGSTATIASNSILQIISGNDHNLPNCSVTNNGTVTWIGGRIRGGGSPGTFIYNNGLWDAKDDLTLNNDYGGSGTTFNNAGIYRKSASTAAGGATTFTGGVVIGNTGQIDAQTNNITLLGGGTFSGGVATNATGFLDLKGGAFTLNGMVTSTNVQLNGGTLTGNNVFRGGFNWIVGDWNNSASETIAPSSLLLITSGSDHNLQNCTVTNSGTVTWLGGRIRGGGTPGTSIYNSGLWDAQDDLTLNNDYSGNGTTFHNTGVLRKSGSTASGGATVLNGGVFLFNTGQIEARTNSLSLLGGGSFTGGAATKQGGLINLSGGGFNINGTVTATNMLLSGANLSGNNVIQGAFNWVIGDWGGTSTTIASNTALLVTSDNDHNMANCVLTNNGTVTWLGGRIRGGGSNPGTFIYNNGLWDAQNDLTLNNDFSGNGTSFNNAGTLRKSASGVAGGSTVFTGGVFLNNTGRIDAQTNIIALEGGGNFTGGIATNPVGLVSLNAGAFNLHGTLTSTNVQLAGGTLTGNNVINGAFNWIAGDWNNSAETIAPNSLLLISSTADHNMANCQVTNNGTVTWIAGRIRGGSSLGTAIYNNGLWDSKDDLTLNDDYSGNGTTFYNLGTLRKSGGLNSSQTLFTGGVLYNQSSGVLDVQTGNLVLQGGGNFAGGVTTTNAHGFTYLSVGSFTVNGTVTSANVIENAGNLVGTNVLAGGFTWVGGSWGGATVTIATNSVLTIAGGGGDDNLPSAKVINYGTVAWTSGRLRGGATPGTSVFNYGLWDAQSDEAFNNDFGGNGTTFNNLGTFRKDLSTGTTTFTGGVTFDNSGTIDAQDGTIALQGAYTLAYATTLSFGLGGPSGNGAIALSGPAAFVGTLSVNLNGGYMPMVGTTFNLLSYTSESGTLFTRTVVPPSFAWRPNYGSTVFSLTTEYFFLISPDETNVTLAWPADRIGWQLQAQTNSIQVGLSTNWFIVPGSTTTNQVVLPIDKTLGTVFFRMASP